MLFTVLSGKRTHVTIGSTYLLKISCTIRLMDIMGGIMSQMPFLRFVIPELSGYNELMRILQKLWGFLDEEITIHEKQLSGNEPQDLIEAFLLEISSNDKTDDSIFDRESYFQSAKFENYEASHRK